MYVVQCVIYSIYTHMYIFFILPPTQIQSQKKISVHSVMVCVFITGSRNRHCLTEGDARMHTHTHSSQIIGILTRTTACDWPISLEHDES